MPTVKENLIAAKALIDTPAKREIFTIYGAIRSVAGDEENAAFDAMKEALKAELPKRYGRAIVSIDVRGTQRAVMALFDLAIAAQDADP